MDLYCCPVCFGDLGLKDIIESLSSELGTCSYCKTNNATLIHPINLRDFFELLISIYKPTNSGKKLVDLMKQDWMLFPNLDNAHSNELLSDILDDGNIVRQTFSPLESDLSKSLARWETLRDELLYKNRYFLEEAIDTDRLRELLDHLKARQLPEEWYRARIVTGDFPFELSEMGAPPNRHASHGRANPAGIPYLYLGSTPDTSISEIRPHTGELACVAKFSIPSTIAVVDLRNPRQLVSPFVLPDSEEISQMRADIPFLERLGYELTKPVLPRSAALDYIPSQYLCEFIKKIGFGGVLYKSSVSDGINLALFNPATAISLSLERYNVQRVSVSITKNP